jgi:hypothetical protein
VIYFLDFSSFSSRRRLSIDQGLQWTRRILSWT